LAELVTELVLQPPATPTPPSSSSGSTSSSTASSHSVGPPAAEPGHPLRHDLRPAPVLPR